MKTIFKRFQYTGKGAQPTRRNGYSNRGQQSTEFRKHPYLKDDFWLNPLNQFWNTALYSEASKKYFNDQLTKI